jgi:hypothetical protein
MNPADDPVGEVPGASENTLEFTPRRFCGHREFLVGTMLASHSVHGFL